MIKSSFRFRGCRVGVSLIQVNDGQQDSMSPETPAAGNPARFDPFELESLMLNLDASLRIRARHQFFGWTQGTLQSLIEHQLLIWALHNGGPATFFCGSFSSGPVGRPHLSEMFRQRLS